MKKQKTINTILILILIGIITTSYFLISFNNQIDELNDKIYIMEQKNTTMLNIMSCDCLNKTVIETKINNSLLEEVNSTLQSQITKMQKTIRKLVRNHETEQGEEIKQYPRIKITELIR